MLGPHVVLADGAVLTVSGSLPLCVAAEAMRVPVVVVAGMFKFSPVYLGEGGALNWGGMRDLRSPDEVLDVRASGDGDHDESYSGRVGGGGGGRGGRATTEVLNPYFDVVPADLVNLYISNL